MYRLHLKLGDTAGRELSSLISKNVDEESSVKKIFGVEQVWLESSWRHLVLRAK